jgi:hypothetical protein
MATILATSVAKIVADSKLFLSAYDLFVVGYGLRPLALQVLSALLEPFKRC